MKIQYCSDLHLEFFQNYKYLKKNPIRPMGDILILAGDILYLNNLHGTIENNFLDYISANFPISYLLYGNHEFYGGFDAQILDNPVYQQIRPNVFIVNNTSVIHNNTTILFK